MGRKEAPRPLGMVPDDLANAAETAPLSAQSVQTADTKLPATLRSPFLFTKNKTLARGKQPQSSDLPQRQQNQQHRHKQSLDDPADPYPILTTSKTHLKFEEQRASPANPANAPTRGSRQHAHQWDQGRLEVFVERAQGQDRAPDHAHNRNHSHHRRDDDKGLTLKTTGLHFGKSARSIDLLHNISDSMGAAPQIMSRDGGRTAATHQPADTAQQDGTLQRPMTGQRSKSDVSLASSAEIDSASSTKKTKPKPFALLGRTRSTKDRETTSPRDPIPAPAPVPINEAEKQHNFSAGPLKTPPLTTQDFIVRDMTSTQRNPSVDRSQTRETLAKTKEYAERDGGRSHPSSLREAPGYGLFSGLKHSKAADLISKGLFGKGSRSNGVEKESAVDDEHYVLKVINLPLIEQTRRTRISKRLESSRDKTEFWMPAFPWRAIDYLNYKGSDVEGLYRVPGSGPQIKKWQRKFDEEGDVDLFEQKDLYDINIIGSMLKAWLRELPDELFPKEAQERIARECAGAESVPQLLIHELSNLSPFNYYLLFAITCHLSLLLTHSDKNKMDFRNLCICFQPCMKIDVFCFKFLVCDWRDCWKGCKNEAKYIEEEYALFDQPSPRPAQLLHEHRPSKSSTHEREDSHEDRNISSSDSGKGKGGHSEAKSKLGKKKEQRQVAENASVETGSTVSTTLTIGSDRETSARLSGEIRPLSPIKPLSPLGF